MSLLTARLCLFSATLHLLLDLQHLVDHNYDVKVVEDAADAVELNFDVLVGVDLVRGLRRPLHYRLEHPPYLSHALLYVLGTAFCASSGQVLRGGHRCAIALALHEITSGWIRAVGFL